MKISIYKINNHLFEEDGPFEYSNISEYLESLNYELSQTITKEVYNGFTIDVWINSENKEKMVWQNEIENLISINSVDSNSKSSINTFSNLGNKYNCIISISKNEKDKRFELFVIPFGYAYNDVEIICDPNFGIDFATKIFEQTSLTITNVNKYFQSTLRQLTNYKRNTFVQSKSSESYDALNGTPIESLVSILGNTVNCSQCVSISKYNLHDFLSKLLSFFSNYKKMNDTIELPKVEKISKNSIRASNLNGKLLEKIHSDKGYIFHIIGYKLYGDSIRLIESEIESVYIKNKKTDSIEKVDANSNMSHFILDFIRRHNEISDLLNIKVVVNDGDEINNLNLIDIVQAELEDEGTIYILSEGYWCIFNDNYLSRLNEYISKIDIKLNTNVSKYMGSLPVTTSGSKITEEDYINCFKDDSGYSITHKSFIKPLKEGVPFGNGFELCDLVKLTDSKELVSIKCGLSTDTTAYSIDQSLLSLSVFSNRNDFEVGNLSEYLDADTIAIQWILPLNSAGLPEKNKNHTLKVLDGTFNLSDLKSVLLKNKIMEWDSRVKEVNKRPIIYLDSPKIN